MAGQVIPMADEVFYVDWKYVKDEWAYDNADDPIYVIHSAGDLRSYYQEGWKIKIIQNGMAAYFWIVGIDYVGGYTLLYLYGGTDYDLTSDPITELYYSPSASPLGFPRDEAKWSIVTTDDSDEPEPSPSAGIWYNSGILLELPIGPWRVYYEAQLKAVRAAAGAVDQFVTLSTTNNSETDKRWTAKIAAEDVKSLAGSVHVENSIVQASKQTYRLLMKTSYSGMDSINIEGWPVRPTRVKAVCGFL